MADVRINLEDDELQRQLESVDVFAAVKEILQSVLCLSKKTGVHVSIKSTKSHQNTPRKSWFYIKVSSRSRIDRTQLEGKARNQALYTILRCMQSLENESHLCIQNPGDLDGEGHHSVQQNLLLEGERLEVLHEVKKSKKVEDSTLHLRVHQSVFHMIKECTHIHSYMAQLRIFRPKADLTFTMKVGEVVSHSDFRIENRKRLSQSLPSIVIDSAFYLQDSSLRPVSESVIPASVDPTFIHVQVMSAQNEVRNISVTVSPVALYIPVEDGGSNYCTLTFYGPGYLPLDVNISCTVLEDVKWSKFGLEIDGDMKTRKYKGLLPCHASVGLKASSSQYDINQFMLCVYILIQTLDTTVDFQAVNPNLQTVLKEHSPTLINVIQTTIDKLLQPILNNAKNRVLVIKSIRGICKAVTDIVSMSSNEPFRTSALECMKVTDTVELGVEMSCKLTDVSRRKHAGVWSGHSRNHFSHSKMGQHDILGVSRIHPEADTGCDVETEVAGEGGDTKTGDEFQTKGAVNVTGSNRISDHLPGDKCHSKLNGRDGGLDILSDQTWKDCVNLHNTCKNFSQPDVHSNNDQQNDQNGTERIRTKRINPDSTPEILQIVDDMDKLSPFFQLVDGSPALGIVKPSPFQNLVNESPCQGIVKAPSLRKLVEENTESEIVSPFQQLVEESPALGIDRVSSFIKIGEQRPTLGIDKVSPFHQLDDCPAPSIDTVPLLHHLDDRPAIGFESSPEMPEVIEDMNQISPFYQLKHDGLDVTPDVSQITRGMKNVTPFQQLAFEDIIRLPSQQISTEDPCLHASLLQTVPDSPVIKRRVANNSSLNSSVNSTSRYRLDPYSGNDAENCHGSRTFSLNRQVSTSDCNKTKAEFSDLQKNEMTGNCTNLLSIQTEVPKSDVELLNSEDFGPTLEVVSDFIDEIEILEKSQTLSDKVQYGVLEESENAKVLKDKQSSYEQLTVCCENTSDISKVLVDNLKNTITENGNKDMNSADTNKENGSEHVQDLDEWFNDVLMEVGEWLN